MPTPPFPEAMATTNRVSLRMSLRATAPAITGAWGGAACTAIVTDRDAFERAQSRVALLFDGLGGRGRVGRQREPERDVAASDREVLDEAEGDDVAREAGVLDLPERVENGLFVERGRGQFCFPLERERISQTATVGTALFLEGEAG